MGVYTPALIKGGLAIGVTSAVAIPVALKGTDWLFGSSKTQLTKWDKDIIDKLSKTGLQFTVTEDSFPKEFTANPQEITVTYSDDSSDGLKTKNNGTAWTWECKIKFKKEGGTSNSFDGSEKDTFTKENTGFLQKLKTEGTSNREIKERFIRKCAEERGEQINKLLNDAANLRNLTTTTSNIKEIKIPQADDYVKSEKLFLLTEKNSKLVIKEEEKPVFKDWFEEQIEESILKKISGSCSATEFSCQLNKGELSKLKIISEDDEMWGESTNLDLTINTAPNNENDKIAEMSWIKLASSDAYFPLGWEFSIKTTDSSKTITVKKTSGDSKTISLSNAMTKFWLKERDKKYYLAKELSQTKKKEKVNINCTNNNCSLKTGSTEVIGLTKKDASTALSVTKKTETPVQYTVAQSTSDGDYKIIYDGEKWTMSKVN